jgi:hypothetical protein
MQKKITYRLARTLRIVLPLFLLISLAGFTGACNDDDDTFDPISLGPLEVTVSITVTPTSAAADGICRLTGEADVRGGVAGGVNNYTWTAQALRRASSSWSDVGSSLSASYQAALAPGGYPIDLAVTQGDVSVQAGDIVVVDCGAATISTTVFGS